MMKIPIKFELKYREDILLRNSPDKRYGVKGGIKNSVVISSDGNIGLDFDSEIFPKEAVSFRDGEKAENLLRRLGEFAEWYVACFGNKTPTYLDYVTDYICFCYGDGSRLKFVLDDMDAESVRAVKALLQPLLSQFGLKTDFGEILPQGVARYVQVVTEKSKKEYSYFWDGAEIAVGEKVLVPFGEENERVRGEVVSVEYYRTDNVPFPVRYIKKIIGKENP